MKLSLSVFNPATLVRGIRGLFTQNARAAPSVIRNGTGASSAAGGNAPPGGSGAFIGNLAGARGAASALAHSNRPVPSRPAPPPPLPPRPAQLARKPQRPTTPPPPPPPQAQAAMGYNIPPPPDFAPPPPPVPPGGNCMPPPVAPRSQAVAAWLQRHGAGNASGQPQAQAAPQPAAAGESSAPAPGTPGPVMPPGALTAAFQAWFEQGGKLIEPPSAAPPAPGKQTQGDWGSRGKGPKAALLPPGYLGGHGKAASLAPVPIRSQAVKDWMQQGEGGKKAQDQRPTPPPKRAAPQPPPGPPKSSLLGERVNPFKSPGGQQPAPPASTQAYAGWHAQGARPKDTAPLPPGHTGHQGKAGDQGATAAAPLTAPVVTPVAPPAPAAPAIALAPTPAPDPQPPEGPPQKGLYAADGWLLESRLNKMRAACAGADSEASDDVDLDDWDED